jgi:tetratricopeptide (TPR) repeat protein
VSGNASRLPDPLEREIEAELSLGRFVSNRACLSLVSGLEQIENRVAGLTGTAPDRAVALYEAFLAGCFEKADEVDDSSGSFGTFAASLFCGWATARQAAGADPGHTAARLLAWMEDDPYGFCMGLEKDVAGVLDKAGLAALVRQVRTRFDAHEPPGEKPSWRGPDYPRRRWGEALRALYAAQKDVGAYVALAEETGLTAPDCHAIATILAARRKPEEALAWAERGIEIDTSTALGSMAGHELADLKRGLLRKLGREDEALESAWTGFCAHPSTYTYRDLLAFVPRHDRTAWHEKAIKAASARAGLSSLIDLLAETTETGRFADLVDRNSDGELEQVSHYVLEPAARILEKGHPGSAARLWRAMSMRILSAGKSRYYQAALANFERARRCYAKAGMEADWEQVVSQVRAEHHRKSGFMPDFNRVVTGSEPAQEPPFLERAKARWGTLPASQA